MSALAVIIEAVRRHGRDVRVDAVGGASAGSIVAVLWAHCLLTGRDATSFLRRAWVDEVDVELLRGGGGSSPLDFADLRGQIVDFLDDVDEHPHRVHAPLDSPLTIQVSLTSMLGLITPVRMVAGVEPLITYADHVEYRLAPAHGPDAIVEPDGTSLLDAVLASASHPGAFPARTFDRSGDAEHYEEIGVDELPDDMRLWYTDGGLVESRPVGRVLDAAREQGGNADGDTRLHLVVDPRSSGPSGTREWADADAEHSWLDGVRRALSILPTQSLHDDLRDIAERNRRMALVDELLDDLRADGKLDDDGDLARRVRFAADVAGQERVDVEIISPLLLTDDEHPDADGVTDLLAGDFIGAFGGFLSREVRRNDYALGWTATERWCRDALRPHGIADATLDQVQAELEDRRPIGWRRARRDGDGVDQLGIRGRWQLFLLALQTGRVLAGEALPSPVSAVRNRLNG